MRRRACDLLILPQQPPQQGQVPHVLPHAIDKILESFHVPCANAAYGCTTKTHYHKVEEHHKSCTHAPCFCPEPGCGFNGGSTVKLLDHLTGGHIWSSTELEYNVKLTLHVKEGVQVLHSRDGGPFFLVKFTPVPPYGNAASVSILMPPPPRRRGASSGANLARVTSTWIGSNIRVSRSAAPPSPTGGHRQRTVVPYMLRPAPRASLSISRR